MGSKLYSIATNTCPKCNVGDFFVTSNPYNFKDFEKLNPNCAYCGELFLLEPGFYTGAMYISYALTVAMTVAAFVGFVVIFDFTIEYVLAGLFLAILLLIPVLFRLSRIIWLNIFVKYDPEKGEMARKKKAAETVVS